MFFRIGMFFLGIGCRLRSGKYLDVHYFERVDVESDLCAYSVAEAIVKVKKGYVKGLPKTLICGPNYAVEAGRLAEVYKFEVILLPLMPEDSWALCWDYCGIYSG